MDANQSKILSQPFNPMFVQWKPQTISKDGNKALAVAFVDPRHYQHRLDEVDPAWSVEYTFIKPDGSLIKCSLTVGGVTREEIGESDVKDDNTAASALAMSFKRACAAFGLGRYLYFLPKVWCEYDPKGRKIASAPALPAWAKVGGSGYPLADPSWDGQPKFQPQYQNHTAEGKDATRDDSQRETQLVAELTGERTPAAVADALASAGINPGQAVVREASETDQAEEAAEYATWFARLDPDNLTAEEARSVRSDSDKDGLLNYWDFPGLTGST